MIKKLCNFLFPEYGILYMKSIFIRGDDILPLNVLKYDYIIVERNYEYNSTLDKNYSLVLPNKNYSNNDISGLYIKNTLLNKLPETAKFIIYDDVILDDPNCYILFKSKKELSKFKLKY